MSAPFTKATLDGRIILAAPAEGELTPAVNANATAGQYRVTTTGLWKNDGAADDTDVPVDFDFSVGRDEVSLNAGFGLFGTTTVEI